MSQQTDSTIRLTQFAHGAGCGCKIAPQVLQEILGGNITQKNFENLLVGNGSNDDAAVYDLGNGQALISTTDFFMPIVDSAFDFGRIASANAISDVYAMGGKPILALAILGWPVNKLSPSLAKEVLDGARSICNEAGIPLAGGHSIDSPEPIFGLSVNGIVSKQNLKKNNTAKEGDLLFLTKPIGVGILSTALKREQLLDSDKEILMKQLTRLNSIGEKLSEIQGLNAMTDVTGFGLLGHLIEMAEGSGLSAELNYEKVPKISPLPHYLKLGTIPDATFRNWNAYQAKTDIGPSVNITEAFSVLPDPQTNGGLLFSVDERRVSEVENLLRENGLGEHLTPIGQMLKKQEKVILLRS
ncbi:MAG: selenide, water dikinase SelD [Bacteroidia bacterium]|nr:selenide, water dikinase SelD [Bacteroidia bacterium]